MGKEVSSARSLIAFSSAEDRDSILRVFREHCEQHTYFPDQGHTQNEYDRLMEQLNKLNQLFYNNSQ